MMRSTLVPREVALLFCALIGAVGGWLARPASASAQSRDAVDESDSGAVDGTDRSDEGESAEAEETTSEDGAEETQPRSRSQTSLRKMNLEEAKRAGFVFGEARRDSSQTTAALVALTGGLVVHGTGHWYIGDNRAALWLLGVEGLSVLLLGTGLAARFAGEQSAWMAGYAGWAVPVGTSLFGLSYLLDIVGAIQRGTPELPTNSRRTRGFDIEAAYHFLRSDAFSVRHGLALRTRLDIGSVYALGGTDQDLSFDTSIYDAALGWRFWRGGFRQTFLYLEGRGELLSTRGVGPLQRWSGEMRLGASVDAGAFVGHLRALAVGVETGYGRRWYRAPGPALGRWRTIANGGYVPVEVFTHFNLSERLHTRVAYRYQTGDFLQRGRRLAGLGSLEFDYASTELVDLEFRLDVGGGVALTGGLGLNLWQ